MLKLILRIVFSLLLCMPCAALAGFVTRTESWAVGAIVLGIYTSSLTALWNTVNQWQRRLWAFVTGAVVAIAFGLIAENLPSSFIYGSVAVAFTGIAVSVVATLLVLGSLRSAKSIDKSYTGSAVPWVIFGIFLASSFVTSPYDGFPLLLTGAVLVVTGGTLMYSVGFTRTGMVLYKSVEENFWTKALLVVITLLLFFVCSHAVSRAIVEVSIRSLPR